MKFIKFVSVALLVISVISTINISIALRRSNESMFGELTEFSCKARGRLCDRYEVELLTLDGERREFDGVGFSCRRFNGLELELGASVQ
jgi:hypothetical protein